MADSGVFRRSRTEARAFHALATGLCVSGLVARLWPIAALVALAVFAAVVLGVAALVRARRRAAGVGSFPFGAPSGVGWSPFPLDDGADDPDTGGVWTEAADLGEPDAPRRAA